MLRWPFPRKLSPQQAYAIWAPTYPPRPHNALMEIEQRTVLALLPKLDGLRVVDAGCGSGRYLQQLQASGADVVGIDLSPAMLSRARQLTRKIARANIGALPLEAMSVDLIVCALALGDVSDLEAAIGEMARVLRPKASIVYSVVHPVGAANGWSRTFRRGGRQIAIDSHWHTSDEHRRACAAAGLHITAWEEPTLSGISEDPAVLVVRAAR